MPPRLVTLNSVKFNNWVVKASIFEEQILIFFYNVNTMGCIVRLFTDENIAHEFLEKVISHDLSSENCYR